MADPAPRAWTRSDILAAAEAVGGPVAMLIAARLLRVLEGRAP